MNLIVNYLKKINWLLLAFLILFLNVSFILKLSILVISFLTTKAYKTKIFDSSVPLFYLIIIGFSFLQILFNFNIWEKNYFIVSSFGIIYWTLSLLALIQIKTFIKNTNYETIENTIILFFIINFLFSCYDICYAIYDSGVLNPYTYIGMYGKYETSTGDHIGGILSYSVVNSIINSLGIIFFIYSRKKYMVLICLVPFLLTTSNLNTLFLLIILLSILLFDKNKLHKSIIICILGGIILFYSRITPENITYSKTTTKGEYDSQRQTVLSKLESEELKILQENKLINQYAKEKINKKHPKEDIVRQTTKEIRITADSSVNIAKNIEQSLSENDPSFIPNASRSSDSKEMNPEDDNEETGEEIISPVHEIKKRIKEEQLKRNKIATPAEFNADIAQRYHDLLNCVLEFYEDSTINRSVLKFEHLPGKINSFYSTYQYLTSNFKPFILGSGAGRFSSKLAFGAANCNTTGGNLISRFCHYVAPEFKNNHFKIYAYYWLQGLDEHSVKNNPSSVYNQIAGEYGLIGIILFIITYLWFFVKRFSKLSYGRIMLPFILFVFIGDYWFEYLSVLVFFEFLILLDLKKHQLINEHRE